MTLKTSNVCRCPGWNSSRGTGTSAGFVAGSAVDTPMPGVIELESKTSKARKALHCSGLGIRMTDRADRTRIVRELKGVAARTGQVIGLSGKPDPRRIVITPVTE